MIFYRSEKGLSQQARIYLVAASIIANLGIKDKISIASNGSAGATYYQSHKFTILQGAYAIKYIYKNLNSVHYLFFACLIAKKTKDQFSWANKADWIKVKGLRISLPITSTGEIDFDFMEVFIRAIEKLVIRDVVLYADKNIETTKQLVSR